MSERKDIVSKIEKIEVELSAWRNRLQEFDYEKEFNKKKEYVGKYYKRTKISGCANLVYVYAVKDLQLQIVEVYIDTEFKFGSSIDIRIWYGFEREKQEKSIKIVTKEEFIIAYEKAKRVLEELVSKNSGGYG